MCLIILEFQNNFFRLGIEEGGGNRKVKKDLLVVFKMNLGSWWVVMVDGRLVRRFRLCAILMGVDFFWQIRRLCSGLVLFLVFLGTDVGCNGSGRNVKRRLVK